MMNYAEMSRRGGVARGDVHDLISDVQGDIFGWAMTLHAIAEQPSVIEPQQLYTISAALHWASEALAEANKTVDTIIYGGKEDD